MPTFELRCLAHGAFESPQKRCQFGCPDAWVKQEIRTAPAYRRKNMGVIDSTLRMIADDHGVTDLKNDAKAGVSVLQALQKTKNVEAPRWMDVPHAKPGFSQSGEGAPIFKPGGFERTSATGMKLPKPTTKVVGSYRG